MNYLEHLLREREDLLKKKEAAQDSCNMPMAEQYRIVLVEIEKKIREIDKGKKF